MDRDSERPAYGAKSAYQDYGAASGYETRPYYQGFLGRYRKRAETGALAALTAAIPEGSLLLDCPCGNGRWFEMLGARASKLIAIDVSHGMIQYAQERAKGLRFAVEVRLGDAEELPLENESVDFAFSYALMKHLPVPTQYRVLGEFSRVARHGVLCSFAVLKHLSYEIWRRKQTAESYPVFLEEVGWMAGAAGLAIDRIRRSSTPLGLEHLILFRKTG